MPVSNPTTFALHSFQHYLEQAGIQAAGELVDIDELPELPDYDKAQLLFVHFSPPLSEIIAVLNKESNNFYAEQVFRTMAYAGSAAGGERRVKDLLAEAGISDPSISIKDGSGLSRKDLVTPQAMVALLDHMARHPQRDAFINSLARGGEAQSTLRGRLGGMPVQAKTGSLEFVRSLSGYTMGADGHTIAFAVFANHFTGPSYQITQTIDQIIRTVTTNGTS
jgi:D-alanyl-D-alanine carboxypeptidase/D-alanyl-D-alanine-endopeptidase (penicillin-binding protein 4)